MRRTVELMLVVAIVLDIAYWSIWFTQRDWIASEHRARLLRVRERLPARRPVARRRLRAGTRRPAPAVGRRALLWLLCAGSAGLYLFGMDLLYDLEHGIFTEGGGGAFEAVIVALTLVFSVTVPDAGRGGTGRTGEACWRAWTTRATLTAKLAEIDDQMAAMEEPPTDQSNISFGKRVGDGTQMAVDRLSQVAVHDQLQVIRGRRTPRAREARRGQLRPLRRVRAADPRGPARGAAVGGAVRRGRRATLTRSACGKMIPSGRPTMSAPRPPPRPHGRPQIPTSCSTSSRPGPASRG